jgi:hypothetical protein
VTASSGSTTSASWTRDERAEHCLEAERVGGCARCQRDEQHRGDVRLRPPAAHAHETQQCVDAALAERERESEEDDEPRDGDRELGRIDRAGLGQARDHAEQDPARDVVRHRGGDQYLRDVAAHEIEIGEDLRDHGQRRDAERGAHEQREHHALGLAADEGVRQRQAEPHAREHGQHEAADRDARGGPAEAADQRRIGLESGQDQEQEDADPRRPCEQRALERLGGEQPVVQARSEMSEDARSEQQARGQLADHRRLPDRAQASAERARGEQQREQLEPEDQELVLGGHRALYASFRVDLGLTS